VVFLRCWCSQGQAVHDPIYVLYSLDRDLLPLFIVPYCIQVVQVPRICAFRISTYNTLVEQMTTPDEELVEAIKNSGERRHAIFNAYEFSYALMCFKAGLAFKNAALTQGGKGDGMGYNMCLECSQLVVDTIRPIGTCVDHPHTALHTPSKVMYLLCVDSPRTGPDSITRHISFHHSTEK